MKPRCLSVSILRKNKKAYFFTIDVIMSMIVLVTGFILIWSFFLAEPSVTQPYFLVEDTMDFLSTTKNSEVGNVEYVHDLILDGDITNLDNTVLEQIAEFLILGKDGIAAKYTENITYDLVPEQFGLEIRMNNTPLYSKAGITGVEQNESRVLMSTKNIVVVVINKTELSAPMVAEVRIWQ